MAELHLSNLEPLQPTDPAWVDAVNADFAAFLCDHASAEKKASGMAMNVAAHYPDKPVLLEAMVDLAVEELNHYREVVRLLLARNIEPKPDRKDLYVNSLNKEIRKGPDNYLLDRLLVGAVVERRGAERFSIVAEHAVEESLQAFYRAIAASEERHWTLFVDLACEYYPRHTVQSRFNALARFEANLISSLPHGPSLH